VTGGLRSVAVVGSGTMGHGIAYVAALSGCRVTLHDADPAALERARGRIEATAEGGLARGKITAETRDRLFGDIVYAPDLAGAVAGADLVVEAVVEDLAVKQGLLARIEPEVRAETLLASNTSSLPVTRLASVLSRPERMLGMHFFNPVHVMQLVELVVHPRTSAEARDAALDFVRRMGKQPIVVRDSPGFASSRLGVAIAIEAMRMVEEGVASAEDIDKAMELGYRHPMGPLRLTDLVGLDVRLAIAETLHRELGAERFRPPEILRRMVAEGHLGQKSGRGFYAWPD
jgi:3-hydroxybutyryl-CoA dehydrogenase